MSDIHLTNPVWHALTGAHLRLSEGNGPVRRYQPEISPFLGLESAAALPHVADVVAPGAYGLVMAAFDIPEPPPGFTIPHRAHVLQMVARDIAQVESPVPLLELGEKDGPEMLALADLTKPGPFGPQTWRMGRFLGIRDNRELVAMTGHRLHLPAHTEVSGVCTHPRHLGRGFAQALVARLTRQILDDGKAAFLQVLTDNHGAIALYRKLGFTDHSHLNVTVLAREDGGAGLDRSPDPRDA